MINLAKETKAYIFKYMTPSYVPEEDLESGMQMSDMYLAMRKKILWPAECHEKATKAITRMPNVHGKTYNHCNTLLNIMISIFTL